MLAVAYSPQAKEMVGALARATSGTLTTATYGARGAAAQARTPTGLTLQRKLAASRASEATPIVVVVAFLWAVTCRAQRVAAPPWAPGAAFC
jgi:hypothetical protein